MLVLYVMSKSTIWKDTTLLWESKDQTILPNNINYRQIYTVVVLSCCLEFTKLQLWQKTKCEQNQVKIYLYFLPYLNIFLLPNGVNGVSTGKHVQVWINQTRRRRAKGTQSQKSRTGMNTECMVQGSTSDSVSWCSLGCFERVTGSADDEHLGDRGVVSGWMEDDAKERDGVVDGNASSAVSFLFWDALSLPSPSPFNTKSLRRFTSDSLTGFIRNSSAPSSRHLYVEKDMQLDDMPRTDSSQNNIKMP